MNLKTNRECTGGQTCTPGLFPRQAPGPAAQGRWEEIIDLTEGLQNHDEAATYLLIQRGIAFREQGFPDAFRESLK